MRLALLSLQVGGYSLKKMQFVRFVLKETNECNQKKQRRFMALILTWAMFAGYMKSLSLELGFLQCRQSL